MLKEMQTRLLSWYLVPTTNTTLGYPESTPAGGWGGGGGTPNDNW